MQGQGGMPWCCFRNRSLVKPRSRKKDVIDRFGFICRGDYGLAEVLQQGGQGCDLCIAEAPVLFSVMPDQLFVVEAGIQQESEGSWFWMPYMCTLQTKARCRLRRPVSREAAVANTMKPSEDMTERNPYNEEELARDHAKREGRARMNAPEKTCIDKTFQTVSKHQ